MSLFSPIISLFLLLFLFLFLFRFVFLLLTQTIAADYLTATVSTTTTANMAGQNVVQQGTYMAPPGQYGQQPGQMPYPGQGLYFSY